MDLDVIEGYIEVKGRHPILVTASHGFGTDKFKELFDLLRSLGAAKLLQGFAPRRSAVDMYTWELAFKSAVAEGCWALLPTVSKVDKVELGGLPDYNLNKPYARVTPFWRRLGELTESGKIKVIVDIHGMKNVRKWPDICLSTASFTTASKELTEVVARRLRALGLRVSVDYPFSGGALIKAFGRPPRVEALAVEIKRSLRYFGSRSPALAREVVRGIKEYLRRSISPPP